jgi:hypothetical protein
VSERVIAQPHADLAAPVARRDGPVSIEDDEPRTPSPFGSIA